MNGFDLTRKQANALVNADHRTTREERVEAQRVAEILARRKARRAALVQP
jgi:hypothetical protein